MSVGDNIAYGLKLRKLPKDEMYARIKKAADMLELTPLLDHKPNQLPGGQPQRVAMGRAIVREPQVFLMDEPLSNLDAKLRVQMRAEISAVVRSLKTTTVYVTHVQIEAMTMGDRMAGMKAGMADTQNARLVKECRDLMRQIAGPGAVCLSFGLGMLPRYRSRSPSLSTSANSTPVPRVETARDF